MYKYLKSKPKYRYKKNPFHLETNEVLTNDRFISLCLIYSRVWTRPGTWQRNTHKWLWMILQVGNKGLTKGLRPPTYFQEVVGLSSPIFLFSI